MRSLGPRLLAPGRAHRLADAVRAAAAGVDLVAIGGDLSAESLLTAYRVGAFPMGLGRGGARPMGWFSPDPRGVIRPGGVHVSRSLRRSAGTMTVTWDRAFAAVMAGCADERRPGRWITAEIVNAYQRLHELGHAHSIEVWQGSDLVGGLYGVSVGELFAGESMFHRRTDASKLAMWAMSDLMARGSQAALIDVQWLTPHLQRMGAISLPRALYLQLCHTAAAAPTPAHWREPGHWEPFAS